MSHIRHVSVKGNSFVVRRLVFLNLVEESSHRFLVKQLPAQGQIIASAFLPGGPKARYFAWRQVFEEQMDHILKDIMFLYYLNAHVCSPVTVSKKLTGLHTSTRLPV